MKEYSRTTIENLDTFRNAKEYRKKVTTKAVKVDGPFRVHTSEGPLECADGYLCLDARGYPYPVATEEFNLIYREDTNDST